MAAYYPNNVTTDHIQQYLDENKSLILKIVDSQNSGKLSECAENQARLQRNLMYLAAIADSQPQPQSMNTVQYSPGGMYQGAGAGSSAQYMQHQQAQQQMTPQSLMAARSSMLYGQQPYPALQHQHSQLGMHSSGGLHVLQGEAHHSSGGGGSSLGIGFSDYEGGGRATSGGGNKHDIGSFLTFEGRGSGGGGGGSSSSGGGDGGERETLYLKSANRD